ncbi:glycosyltransferase [Tamlana fucoidanivorans]|uniref:Glycosyltransferase n=1 Tax=Allotamlana fucoidanivorans TaxID=2583814 RepID=A0A5C4SQN8_9FLAO|nr:glycosyltransferase [Tamlana fucoidanivorans]TNJ45766.1 glycosyltransferase [Tamlana fucoidanivorans]
MLHNNNPHISIVLPCYNGERFLSDAIKSCLNQSYTNFELIIINDCSTDKTADIANQFAKKDHRINIITNKTNKKLPASLNIGHRRAKGDFITWTSDDNVLKPNFLEKMIQQIIESRSDLVYSNYEVINENGGFKRIHITGPTEHILFGNKIGASFLYKKEVFSMLNGYDESLFLLEDYEFWLRASMQFKFIHVKEVLYEYRLHEKSLTANIQQKNKAKSNHKKGVLKMFNKLADKLSWNYETLQFIKDHFLHEQVNLLHYMSHKNKIDQDILLFNPKRFNEIEVERGINEVLRSHLLSDICNRNLKTCFRVLRSKRELLLHTSYSRRYTLQYVLKSIFK